MRHGRLVFVVLLAVVFTGDLASAQPARREFYEKSTSTFFNPQQLVSNMGRRAAPKIIEAISTPGGINPGMAYQAIQQLALTGHPDVDSVLERFLKGGMLPAQWQAATRDAIIKALADRDTLRSRKALARALDMPENRNYFAEIVKLCGRLRAAECAPAIVAYIKREKRYYDDSLINLAQCSGQAAVELISKQLGGRKGGRFYDYEILALGVVGQPGAKLLLDTIAAEKRPRFSGKWATNIAWALGRMQGKDVVPLLRKIASGGDPMAVYQAALSLAAHADRASLDVLQRASGIKLKRDTIYTDGGQDSDWGCFRRERLNQAEFDLGLAYARCKLGERDARAKLSAASRGKDKALALLADAFLLRLGEKQAAGRIASKILGAAANGFAAQATDQSWNQDMQAAVAALAELNPKLGVEVVMELSAASHWMYKELGQRLLGVFPRSRQVAALVSALGRGSYARRTAARDWLRRMGEPILKTIEKKMPLLDQDGRVLAVELLGEFDDKAGAKVLTRMSKRDKAWQVRSAAGQALAIRSGESWPQRVKMPPAKVRPVVYNAEAGIPEKPVGAAELGGKVFVAGQEGLSSYDGYQWHALEAKGLCQGPLSAIASWKGKLLVFSKGGVASGNGRRFGCLGLKIPPVRLVLSDGARLLLGTDKGLYEFSGKRATLLTGSPTRRVSAMTRRGKELWVGYDIPQISVTVRYSPQLSAQTISGALPPSLYRVTSGRFVPVVEPLLAYAGWRLPMDVKSLAADSAGRLYVGCTEGILTFDGRAWNMLDNGVGYDARYPVDALYVSRDGSLHALQGLWIDSRDAHGRWHRNKVAREGIVESSLLMAERTSSTFVRSNGDTWLVVGDFAQYGNKMLEGMALRVAGADTHLRKLPPETLFVMAKAGEWRWENPETRVGPKNEARVAGGKKPVEIPAAQASIEAAAQDPWDYEAVSFQFKLDEKPWSKWQTGNGLLTPLLGEGQHLLRARARDESGNIDPSPAVLHFTVHTRELAVVRILDGKFKSVFPSQYRRYESEGLGSVELENRATHPVKIKVNMLIQDLFDTPAARTISLPAGAKKWIDLGAPFNDKILAMGSGGQVQAVVELEFEHEGIQRQLRRTFPLTIEPANAFDWSDPSRLAGFINSADPAVVAFGSRVFRAFSGQDGARIIPLRNLALAAYLFRALDSFGIRYKPDEESPFSKVKPGSGQVIDSVRFPAQTLQQKVGDCDDLVVLYTSLLEQVGIRAAVVPVEGHVFAMFDSGVIEDNRGAFKVPDQLLVKREGSLWIPVEVTWLGRRGATFEQAWSAGAEAYHGKYRPRSEQVVEVRTAWAQTPPAAFAGVKIPQPAHAVVEAGRQEVTDLLAGYRQAVIGKKAVGGDPAALLERGRLLAKNGFFDAAEAALDKARAGGNDSFEVAYALGVVHAGQLKTEKALADFGRAESLTKDNLQLFRAAMALATTLRSAGKTEKARQACERAMKLNPAARFDSKYAGLIRFLRSAQKTKAAGGQAPPQFFQQMLAGM
jgi:HEAT repeat protein